MGPFIFFPLLIMRIKSIKYLLRDKSVPKRHKLLVILGILYLLSPVDLIPIVVLGFGIVDDIVIWLFILNYLKNQLDKYAPEFEENKDDVKDKLKNKKVIDISDYVIKKKEDEKNKAKER